MKGDSMKTVKYLIAICMLQFIAYLPICAQVDSIKQIINDIKLNADYIFGEAENKEEKQAYDIAVRDLLYSVNSLRENKGMTLLDQSSIEQRLQKMTYQRGDLSCVFMYVKKTDMISSSGELESEELKPEETRPEGDAQENQIQVINPIELNMVDESIQLDVLQNVLEREMIVNVWQYLTNMKGNGKIADLGKPRSLADIPESAYVIIYDKTFKVVSVLAPFENGTRMNVREEKPDAISKYSGHGVVWYKF